MQDGASRFSVAQLVSQVTTPIVEVLHTAGTLTIGFHEAVSRAKPVQDILPLPLWP
ncbi:hypothetical protein SBA6_560002 [Candidatus Sulfopaludibacter sp. SbA6]|nr:hypothetical protein SBA6_560002 [Candidatus Sulfopaludibacter sp. SbA6]